MNEYFPKPSNEKIREEMKSAGFQKLLANNLNLELIPKHEFIILILDILEKFAKQTELLKLSQYVIYYAYKKGGVKHQAAKFCANFDYTLEVHSKVYRECQFFYYLFNFDQSYEVIKFYLKSRKLMMQFFFDNANSKYHDAEALNLELDQWVIITNRIFNDSSRSVDNLNQAIIRHAISNSEESLRKTIDGVSFLEYCLLEFLRSKGFISDPKINIPTSSSRSYVSPSPRKEDKDVYKTPKQKHDETSSYSKTDQKSMIRSTSLFSKPITSAKLDRNISSPVKEINKSGGIKERDKSIDNFFGSDKKKTGTFLNDFKVEVDPANLNLPQEISNLKKERKFLQGELSEQINEKRRLEDYITRTNKSYNNLQQDQQKLIDFTVEVQRNFIYLFEYLKQKSSINLNDPRFADMLYRIESFDDYKILDNKIELDLSKTSLF